MPEKAQVVLFDLAIAATIFLFLFISLNSVWIANLNALPKQTALKEMQFKAVQLTEMLVKSPGQPENWHLPGEAAQLIGLAEKNNVLSQEKLAVFAAMDYDQLKDLMQVKNLDFFFQLTGSQDVNVGKSIPSTAIVVSIERIVDLNGSEARVKFNLFKEE